MKEIIKDKRKEKLKELIRKLHSGVSPAEVKIEFKEMMKGATPAEIAQAEEELVKEGMPVEEIHSMCDVHISVMKETLNNKEDIAPEGHPINILMQEHKIMTDFAIELKNLANKLKNETDNSNMNEYINKIKNLIDIFKDAEKHYLREENVLFPYLEKHGITQPPKVMWMEHDMIRTTKKNIYELINIYERISIADFSEKLSKQAMVLCELLPNHFFKENNILFPTSLNVILENEWNEIETGFKEIGYCCFSPKFEKETIPSETETDKNILNFETGSLSKEELENLLNVLPFDITFVDKDDTFKYFNKIKDQIFIRVKASIGRKVQNCHPQKSVHLVNKIISEFKDGSRDVADFWINKDGKLIYIRYFAVRNSNNEYLGAVEITQDITEIKKIEGEKRLL